MLLWVNSQAIVLKKVMLDKIRMMMLVCFSDKQWLFLGLGLLGSNSRYVMASKSLRVLKCLWYFYCCMCGCVLQMVNSSIKFFKVSSCFIVFGLFVMYCGIRCWQNKVKKNNQFYCLKVCKMICYFVMFFFNWLCRENGKVIFMVKRNIGKIKFIQVMFVILGVN